MAGSGPDNRDFHGHMAIRVLSSTVSPRRLAGLALAFGRRADGVLGVAE